MNNMEDEVFQLKKLLQGAEIVDIYLDDNGLFPVIVFDIGAKLKLEEFTFSEE